MTVEAARDRTTGSRAGGMSRQERSPRGVALLEGWWVSVGRPGQRAVQDGCGTGSLALELSSQTETVSLRLQEIFETQVDMIESVIAEAASAAT